MQSGAINESLSDIFGEFGFARAATETLAIDRGLARRLPPMKKGPRPKPRSP